MVGKTPFIMDIIVLLIDNKRDEGQSDRIIENLSRSSEDEWCEVVRITPSLILFCSTLKVHVSFLKMPDYKIN